MNRSTAILILFLASLLEAGGDAVMRTAIRSAQTSRKVTLFAAGAMVLFVYGYVVNAPPWDFGRLLGLYVVFFFVFGTTDRVGVLRPDSQRRHMDRRWIDCLRRSGDRARAILNQSASSSMVGCSHHRRIRP